MCKALDLSDCVLKEKGKSFFTDLFLFSYFLFVCLFVSMDKYLRAGKQQFFFMKYLAVDLRTVCTNCAFTNIPGKTVYTGSRCRFVF